MERFVEREARHETRVRCRVLLGGRELIGHASGLNETGLQVVVERRSVDALTVEPGTRLAIAIEAPSGGRKIDLSGDVVWTRPKDYDLDGREVFAMGVRLAVPSTGLIPIATLLRPTVLAVDDEVANLDVLRLFLRDEFTLLTAESADAALALLAKNEVSVIVTDHRMPTMTGLDFLRQINKAFPQCQAMRIVLSAYQDPKELQAFINDGHIFYWIDKPLKPENTLTIIRRAAQHYSAMLENRALSMELEQANQRLQSENRYLKQRLTGIEGFENIVGASVQLRQSLAELSRIQKSDVPVHIVGETGTGKELVARALHFGGARQKASFVAQNCAGLTEALLQSTLFGHVKGSFTGADRDRKGLFQEADNGTLFLDEVAELPLTLQAALLRALQEGEVMPVGASKPTKVNVRVLSATHSDLREEVNAGRFREDLYYRLVVISVRLPSLRERAGDIALLARHFLDLLCERYRKNVRGLSPDAMAALEAHSWPGNVRELENELERAVVLADAGELITPSLLSPHIQNQSKRSVAVTQSAVETRSGEGVFVPYELSYDDAVVLCERAFVQRALGHSNGVITQAADALQMKRSRLTKLRTRLGL